MVKGDLSEIPVYTINQFNRTPGKAADYQVEIFDSNREFKVSYPHRHQDFYEILYIRSGYGKYIIDFVEYVITAETVFFLSPGQIHEIHFSVDTTGYIFLFSSAFYHFNKSNNKLFELPFFYSLSVGSPPLLLKNDKDGQVITQIFISAINENDIDMPEKEDAIRAYLDLLLIYFKRLYPTNSQRSIRSLITVKRFKQLIETHCKENLAVKEYAELLRISPSHLNETVKIVTGRTATDLINDRLLIEIKRYLIQSDLSISEISFKLNFADQSYFSKYFKKLTHYTPQEFRVKHSRGLPRDLK